MVGTNKQLPQNDGTYLRKIRKPLIEKKRRERMNQSITQLRALIDDTVKQNVAPMTRVDKADILELTVCHLTKLRHQQPVTMTTDKRMSYAAGFQDCADHVTSFLAANGLVDNTRLMELNQHLQLAAARGPNVLEDVEANTFGFHTSTPYCIPPRNPRRIVDTTALVPEMSPVQFYSSFVQHYGSQKRANLATPLGKESNEEESMLSFSGSLGSFSTEHKSPSMTSLSALTSSSEDFSTSDSSATSSIRDRSEECQTVSIGTGSENMIGHVIQETTWRPW